MSLRFIARIVVYDLLKIVGKKPMLNETTVTCRDDCAGSEQQHFKSSPGLSPEQPTVIA